MAVPGNTTVRSNVTEIVPAEWIQGSIIRVKRPSPLFVSLANVDVVPAGRGSTVNIPTLNAITVTAGVKTEGDVFTVQQMDTAETTMTGGFVGMTVRLTYEAIHDAAFDMLDLATTEALAGIMNRIDSDGFALCSSLTNVGVDVGTAALVDADVQEAVRQFHENNPIVSGMPVGVLNAKQLLDWSLDLSQNGGAQLGADEASRQAHALGSYGQGFKGIRHGVAWYLSNNIPVATGEATGYIGASGPLSPFWLRSWQEIQVKQEDDPTYASVALTYMVRYGVAIADQAQAVSITSDGA
jgi:hypothetical protein